MKAIRVDGFGPPSEVVRYLDVPEPEPPHAGEVLVEMIAAPINPSDLLILHGVYGALPSLPTIPGKEGVGRVLKVGPEVSDFEPGQRVLLPLNAGTWRERLKVSASQLLRAPEDAPIEQLAMATLNPLAAYYVLHTIQKLEAGEWIVQNAANSAFARWVIAHAKARGIRTVNVVRRSAQCAPLRKLGADVALADGHELGKRVKAAIRGAPIRLALDAVGGGATTRMTSCVDHGGTVVCLGTMGGDAGYVGTNDLVFRDIHVRGFWFASMRAQLPQEWLAEVTTNVIDTIAKGTVTIPVEASYPLERIKDAVEHAEREGRSGKILLVGTNS
ncbi:MAG TPA: zinc-dependent alcohol dehydrogenase family protein [Polyangium sp.]|nr:zinc-dependent alcohol dehydrogenase family protein [Polyangium sp.]